jgi:hypothetical protein
MLYDNSQLARVYLHAWQVTGNEFFQTIRTQGAELSFECLRLARVGRIPVPDQGFDLADILPERSFSLHLEAG